jgi:hypothetical protein
LWLDHTGDDLPPVDEAAWIDCQPAVGDLDFDSAHDELIDQGNEQNQQHADQNALEEAGLTYLNFDADLGMTAFCVQTVPLGAQANCTAIRQHSEIALASAEMAWCRERESNPHEVALIGF